MIIKNFLDIKEAYYKKGYKSNCHDLALGFIEKHFGSEQEWNEYMKECDDLIVAFDEKEEDFKPKYI